jgi:hypothetical protein
MNVAENTEKAKYKVYISFLDDQWNFIGITN